MKYIWWTLIALWSIPESIYMIAIKEMSSVSEFLFKKVNL
jgi:hypothetical protein